MNSDSFKSDNKNSKSIVADHDSATQTSEREILLYRIEKIRNPETRRVKQEAFTANEEADRALDARIAQAEAAYIDKNLHLNSTLEITPSGMGRSYEDKIRDLKKSYATSQEALDLSTKIEAQKEQSWRALSVSVNAELRRQDHHHRR